jgi:glycosyltransferase involved in cell wall biosynthesis
VKNLIGAADVAISYVPINQNYNYNPPLKTFEYLACGLPVIATRTVSNSKIIKDGFNGILADDKVEDLATALSSLIRDRSKQAYLRRNSRNSIEEFDFDKITKTKLIPLYRQLLD